MFFASEMKKSTTAEKKPNISHGRALMHDDNGNSRRGNFSGFQFLRYQIIHQMAPYLQFKFEGIVSC